MPAMLEKIRKLLERIIEEEQSKTHRRRGKLEATAQIRAMEALSPGTLLMYLPKTVQLLSPARERERLKPNAN
jgi:hypothetical protein